MKTSIHYQLAIGVLSFIFSITGCISAEIQPNKVRSLEDIRAEAQRKAARFEALKAQLNVDESVDLCEGLVTDKVGVRIQRVRKPPFMKYYREPAFSTRVIRITDSEPHEVQKPVYSTMQAWNADESLLLLYRTGPKHNDYVLLDGQDYRFLKSLNFRARDIEQVFWSHTDPDSLYYLGYGSSSSPDHGWFVRLNVRTGKLTRIRKFDRICPNAIPTSGNGVQMQSLDDDLFGFRCQLQDSHLMFSYRISTDTISQVKTGEGTRWGAWHAPMPAPSGKRMEVQGHVVGPDLYLHNHKLDQAVFHEHSSLGRTWNGQDALFQTIFDPSPNGCDGAKEKGVAHLTEFNLETGKCRAIVSQAEGWPYTTSGTHISGVAHFRPGWVAMSSIGYGDFRYFDGRFRAPALMSEIYLVNTDPANTKVCRLAQHRSYSKDAKNGDYHPYFGEPHATISPSGTRLLFGSDWYDSGSVDSYVIELPAYRRQ